MNITTDEALTLFQKQIKRRTFLKALMAPVDIKETGLICRILARKVSPGRATQGERHLMESGYGVMRLKVSVFLEGQILGSTGMKTALGACESMAVFSLRAERLEDETGSPIANITLHGEPVDDDGIFEDPGDASVAWLKEEYQFEITIR